MKLRQIFQLHIFSNRKLVIVLELLHLKIEVTVSELSDVSSVTNIMNLLRFYPQCNIHGAFRPRHHATPKIIISFHYVENDIKCLTLKKL